MGLQGYVGSAQDQARIRQLEQAREEESHRLEEAKKAAAAQPKSFRQWEHGTAEVIETAFKKETIGLVSREEYVEKKSSIQARLEDEARKRKRESEADVEQRRAAKLAANAHARRSAKLSFLQDDDDEGADGEDEPPLARTRAAPAAAEPACNGNAGATAASEVAGPSTTAELPQAVRMRKNDEVATGFLPDAQRQREKEDLRAQLKQQWLQEQESLKERTLTLRFSYWDGSGHQRVAAARVGDTIATFLKNARTTLEKDFPQLRHASVPNLLFVKDNVLLPQAMTFYTCIVAKAHDGRGAPLFDVDAPVDAQKAHACKVVQRSWYESNKHIYPASHWEQYSDAKHIGK